MDGTSAAERAVVSCGSDDVVMGTGDEADASTSVIFPKLIDEVRDDEGDVDEI